MLHHAARGISIRIHISWGGSEYLVMSSIEYCCGGRTTASIVVDLAEPRQQSRRMHRMPEWESIIYDLMKWSWGGEPGRTI